jgi:hypothetical protein
MDDYISKPIDAEALLTALSQWTGHREGGADIRRMRRDLGTTGERLAG